MIKRFCDICEKEITKENEIPGTDENRLTGELRRNGNSLKITVMTALNGTANDGDFCKYCVLDALLKADDRPKAYFQNNA